LDKRVLGLTTIQERIAYVRVRATTLITCVHAADMRFPVLHAPLLAAEAMTHVAGAAMNAADKVKAGMEVARACPAVGAKEIIGLI
jgi:hypothetical protein